MTQYRKGYDDAIKDITNIMKPYTKSFKQYVMDDDIIAAMRDYEDALREVDVLQGRNTQ